MKLQDRLISLAEYGVGFNMHDGNVLVNITYKEGWSVIEPSDDTITFMSDDKRPNTYYYSAPLTTDMSHIFEAIDETVNYNKELEEKVRLFQQRVEDMQELFAKRPLSELKTMKFVFDEETPAPKKKTQKKAAKKTRKAAPKEEGVPVPPVPEETEPAVNEMDLVIQSAINEKEKDVNYAAV